MRINPKIFPETFICPSGMFSRLYQELLAGDSSRWGDACGSIPKMAELAETSRLRLGLGYYGIPFSLCLEAQALGAVISRPAGREPEIVPATLTLEGIPSYNPTQSGDAVTGAIRELKSAGQPFPVIGSLTGPVTLLSRLTDASGLFKSMLTRPETVHRALEHVTGQTVAFGRAQVEAGADALVLGEPIAGSRILGPKHFSAFCAPYLYRIICDIGADYIILHICGRVDEILPEVEKLPVRFLSLEAGGVETERLISHKIILRSICGNG